VSTLAAVPRLRRRALIVGSVLLLLSAAGIAAAANRPQWIWPKLWAESQLRKHFPGTTPFCDPVGPPTHEVGYNGYAEFACAVTLSGGAHYVLVIKPRGRVAWTTLSIEKVSSLPSSRGAVSPAAAGASRRAPAVSTRSTHRLIDKSLDGSSLTLQDGSKWLVSPVSQYETVLWLLTDDVAVLEGADPSYPYQLVDTRAGSSASARYLGR
jgi:hypothetical protein